MVHRLIVEYIKNIYYICIDRRAFNCNSLALVGMIIIILGYRDSIFFGLSIFLAKKKMTSYQIHGKAPFF